ncbi:MAG: CRISPR-associated endoribonuclease Cas6 [Nitrososphaeria archaeon]
MRLLLDLLSACDQRYQLDYHYSIQSFIYNLLKDSSLEYLHSKKGYKFFCFSNIFPYTPNISKGDVKQLLISSPSTRFINHISFKLKDYRNNKVLRLGKMKFILKNITSVEQQLQERNGSLRLISATPIVIRIPKIKYDEYNISPPHPYEYVYWRKGHPFKLFIEQLEDNLYKKYEEFTRMSPAREQLIDVAELKKQVSKKISIHGTKHILIGTLWEFIIFKPSLNKELLKLLQFGLDCGFGERNSLGFGFINILRQKTYKVEQKIGTNNE